MWPVLHNEGNYIIELYGILFCNNMRFPYYGGREEWGMGGRGGGGKQNIKFVYVYFYSFGVVTYLEVLRRHLS